jgi:hypothetical protein
MASEAMRDENVFVIEQTHDRGIAIRDVVHDMAVAPYRFEIE